mgnify:CR=1 FL=1
MKNKILIIGSEGLIGSDLCTHLSKKYEIYKVDIKLKNSNNSFKVNLNNSKNVKKMFKSFLNKKIYFNTIINTTYPKRKALSPNFIDFNVNNFEKDLRFHLIPFYSILLNSYVYYDKIKKKGQVISFSSIYGLKIPNFKIYENTKIKSPIMYSSSKAALSIMSQYFSKWCKYLKKDICFTCVNPAGVKDNQSKIFQKNYKSVYKAQMLNKRTVSKKILKIINSPKTYDGKNVLVTNGIILKD